MIGRDCLHIYQINGLPSDETCSLNRRTMTVFSILPVNTVHTVKLTSPDCSSSTTANSVWLRPTVTLSLSSISICNEVVIRLTRLTLVERLTDNCSVASYVASSRMSMLLHHSCEGLVEGGKEKLPLANL